MSTQNDKTIRLGIVMAGAVSAGAYTGGVIDYYFQMMDQWEQLKLTGKPGIPTHNVRLDVLSGASAGGMTAGMAVAAMQQKRGPVTKDKRTDETYKKKNILYNAWVNLVADDMIPCLLATNDIDRNKKVVSALNADFIKEIADREIKKENCTEPDLPAYVNKDMEVILTLSNLQGFDYRLYFSGLSNIAKSSYHEMTQFRDLASFRMGLTYAGDGRIPLNINAGVGVTELCQAAPATGAFPVGLAIREFTRKKKYIFDNKDIIFDKPNDPAGSKKVNYDLIGFTDGSYKPEDDYTTYNADGGLINNQPFDTTIKIMDRQWAKDHPDSIRSSAVEVAKEENFDATIIMINPFPSAESVIGRGGKKIAGVQTPPDVTFPFGLSTVIGKVFHTMREELLFKGEDIVSIFDESDFSRFLISPKRYGKDEIFNGSKAIACGFLDGFGGFIDKRFREHDFYLGRANAQNFFRYHFCVQLGNDGIPVNPVIAAGYDTAAITRLKFQDKLEVKKMGAAAPWYVPIIPDLLDDGSVNTADENPDGDSGDELGFPVYDMDTFDNYKPAILARIKAIAMYELQGGFKKFLFKMIFTFYKGKIYEALRGVIEQSMIEWQLTQKTNN